MKKAVSFHFLIYNQINVCLPNDKCIGSQPKNRSRMCANGSLALVIAVKKPIPPPNFFVMFVELSYHVVYVKSGYGKGVLIRVLSTKRCFTGHNFCTALGMCSTCTLISVQQYCASERSASSFFPLSRSSRSPPLWWITCSAECFHQTTTMVILWVYLVRAVLLEFRE